MRRRIAVVLVVLVVAAGAGAAWWAMPSRVASRTGVDLGTVPRGVAPGRLNVIVLTLDTTRWDRLGCYGARDAATPTLDRLAADGVLFEQAFAAAPLTLPAHATIFTGTPPPIHGVRDNGGYVLDQRQETLAEIMKRHGRRTAAFVGAFVLDSRWGLDQGFERYVDDFEPAKYQTVSLGDIARRGEDVVNAALPWLDEHAGEPFFAWLHFYDPHSPYDPPEPFKSAFPERPYAGEIAYVDAQIARVVHWLESRGLIDRTIVVALGDHGESLNEHGEATHGLFIYDSTIHVPLIVRAPFSQTRGRRVPSVVRAQDVLATVLDLTGIDPPGEAQSTSLVPLMTGAVDDLDLQAYSESYYARHHYGWSELRSLRAGGFKIIDAPRPELFAWERDPTETHNLYDASRELADRMAQMLARLESSGARLPRTPAAIDAETRARLAALGYIATPARVDASTSGARLPDPKDNIDIFNLLLTARENAGKETGEQPIDRLRRVLARDPKIIDAWIMLGNEHLRRRQPAAALTHYQKALELNPDYDLAIINMASAYRDLGNIDAAILGYQRYLERDPRNAYVRSQMGELLVGAGRLDRAEEALRQALGDDPQLASARNVLGVVALARGDIDAAEREVTAALALRPDVRRAHFNLGVIAEQRQDFRRAIDEYTRELGVDPGSHEAAFNMARVHDRLGQRAEYESALLLSIRLKPEFAEGRFYLAKLYLDQGQRLDEAAALARQGLDLSPSSTMAPLGHYILADIYERQGRGADAAREAERGRRAERRGVRARS